MNKQVYQLSDAIIMSSTIASDIQHLHL